MKSSTRNDGHRCEYCRGALVTAKVNVYRHRGRKHLLIVKVPALVCHECGHRIFEADGVKAMERALAHRRRTARKTELVILTA